MTWLLLAKQAETALWRPLGTMIPGVGTCLETDVLMHADARTGTLAILMHCKGTFRRHTACLGGPSGSQNSIAPMPAVRLHGRLVCNAGPCTVLHAHIGIILPSVLSSTFCFNVLLRHHWMPLHRGQSANTFVASAGVVHSAGITIFEQRASCGAIRMVHQPRLWGKRVLSDIPSPPCMLSPPG
jgi:hypothetical protein